jgi:hypothetical protein
MRLIYARYFDFNDASWYRGLNGVRAYLWAKALANSFRHADDELLGGKFYFWLVQDINSHDGDLSGNLDY